MEIEEKFPFTKNLFDDLQVLLKEIRVRIDDIDHQHYKERYTFKRNGETAVLDFEYNKNGFFGRVVPLANKTNSKALLHDMQKALQTFKQQEHAS